MEMVNCPVRRISILSAAILMMWMMAPVSGQMTTACTNSLFGSFTPCFNFLTGSTNGGGPPTADCCNALESLISSSIDCACLILTGNVPFSIPFLGPLTLSLPRLCGSMSVPLQCKGTAAPLPGPGSVSYGPSLPPLPSTGSDAPTGLHALFSSPPPSPSPREPKTSVVITDTPKNQAQLPLAIVSSTAKLSHIRSPFIDSVFLLGAILILVNHQ